MGLWAIVTANIIGTLVACAACAVLLKRKGFPLFIEAKYIYLVLFEGLIIWAIGYTALQWLGSNIIAALSIGISAVILAVLFPPIEKEERQQLRSLISKRKSKAVEN